MTKTFGGRESFVDALRALMLLGVFVANSMGYINAPNYPLPVGAPSEGSLAVTLNGLIFVLFQHKEYPLLCILFGYSLCYVAYDFGSTQKALPSQDRKHFKLLLLGLVHGVFLYFGDILTMYAIIGFLVSRWVRYRASKLMKILKGLTYLVAIQISIFVLIGLVFWNANNSFYKTGAIAFGNDLSVGAFFEVNAGSYLANLRNILFILPTCLWLTVMGVLARRFRLLSRRRVSRQFWSGRFAAWQFGVAICLSALLGLLLIAEHSAQTVNFSRISAITLFNIPLAIWTVLSALAMLMRHWHRQADMPTWMAWLAPAGRHTLAMYLFQSVAMVLTNGAFLDLQASTPVRLLVVLFVWFGIVAAARQATTKGLRDPVASWLAARNKNRVEPAYSMPSVLQKQ